MNYRIRYYVGLSSVKAECTPETIRERLLAELDARFDGYTLFEARGQWQGNPEPSVVAEVIQDRPPEASVALGAHIARVCGQQSVLVTCETIAAAFLEPGNGLATV